MISIYQLREKAILDNITKNMDFSDCLFEVATNAPQSLIDLQETLKPICENPKQFNKRNTQKIAKRISKKLQDFTGIKNVKVEFHKNYLNFAVLPIYDFEDQSKLSNNIGFLSEAERIEDIKDVEKIDPSITGLHLFIGLKFIKKINLNADEIIAVLLHEIGHIFYHKKAAPKIIKSLMRLSIDFGEKITTFGLLARWIYFKLNGLSFATSVIGPILLSIVLTLKIASRSLSFLEHKEEYGCDKVAARFGYGEEMSSVLMKISEYKGETKNQKVSKFGKVVLFLKTIFNSRAHPVTPNRICELSKNMLNDYAKTYPIAKTEIEKQMKNLRC